MNVGCTPATVTEPKVSSISKEVEAREAIRSILFDQRTHYIGNQTFTTSLKNPSTMNSKMETPNYTYRIKPKPSKEKGVVITATPRQPGLRSFTGVAFAIASGKDKQTMSEICETTKPSKTAPKAPAAPQRINQMIQCPVGSKSSMSFLAAQ
ncbi:MAG: type IV pilin-like G/H family protein [Leptolyngbyaceae cyanobacterium bins.349]|nr:type IV pilin-like G/H family protein [Leptolyngbyaceae cyanobacterium bins.349]